ncbi:MAG: NUDIX domain-containing protein [Proteobacteria bacterium]|nr:NUDIX domain-containing protein [Pseudomonadota bacterium]MDA1299045.1 NUDIX domain-containing protein [Pseudomonadota bacterium]
MKNTVGEHREVLGQTRLFQTDGLFHGVVVACRRGDGRWLLIRRGAGLKAAPLRVCFPGGGVEGDESQYDTVIREMYEELSVAVEPIGCVWESVSTQHLLKLWGWHAELLSEKIRPDPHEVAEVLWLTESEIRLHPDLIPNTTQFLDALLR